RHSPTSTAEPTTARSSCAVCGSVNRTRGGAAGVPACQEYGTPRFGSAPAGPAAGVRPAASFATLPGSSSPAPGGSVQPPGLLACRGASACSDSKPAVAASSSSRASNCCSHWGSDCPAGPVLPATELPCASQ